LRATLSQLVSGPRREYFFKNDKSYTAVSKPSDILPNHETGIPIVPRDYQTLDTRDLPKLPALARPDAKETAIVGLSAALLFA
jgi:hypothetical protein